MQIVLGMNTVTVPFNNPRLIWTKSAIADTTSTSRTASTSSLSTTITSYNGTIPTSSSATTTVAPIPNRLTTTSHHRVGTIVGSVIGSVVGLAALTALALVIWREKNRRGVKVPPEAPPEAFQLSPDSSDGRNLLFVVGGELPLTQVALVLMPKYSFATRNEVEPLTHTKIAWAVFEIGGNNRRVHIKLPVRLAFRAVEIKGKSLISISTPFELPMDTLSCSLESSAAASLSWEKDEKVIEDHVAVKNKTSETRQAALGTYHDVANAKYKEIRPFLVVDIPGKVVCSAPQNLLLRAYRTTGCRTGMVLNDNMLDDVLLDVELENLEQNTTFKLTSAGPVKLEVIQ